MRSKRVASLCWYPYLICSARAIVRYLGGRKPLAAVKAAIQGTLDASASGPRSRKRGSVYKLRTLAPHGELRNVVGVIV